MRDQKTAEERRQYFRIQNKLYMCYELVENDGNATLDTVKEPDESKVSMEIELLNELSQLEEQNKQFLKTLDKADNRVINHISSVNSRLSLLSKRVIQALDVDFSELMDVDISGGGLRFESDKSLKTEQRIKLELILMPKYIGMTLFAKVVDSIALNTGDGFCVAIEFIEISESDRDAIIGHIFKTQSKRK